MALGIIIGATVFLGGCCFGFALREALYHLQQQKGCKTDGQEKGDETR